MRRQKIVHIYRQLFLEWCLHSNISRVALWFSIRQFKFKFNLNLLFTDCERRITASIDCNNGKTWYSYCLLLFIYHLLMMVIFMIHGIHAFEMYCAYNIEFRLHIIGRFVTSELAIDLILIASYLGKINDDISKFFDH